jgi:hypothetical protein
MRTEVGATFTRRLITHKTLALGGLTTAQPSFAQESLEIPFCGVLVTLTQERISELQQLARRFHVGQARATWAWSANRSREGVVWRVDFTVARGLIVGECVPESGAEKYELVGIHPSNLLKILRSEAPFHAFGASPELEREMERIAPLNNWTQHHFSTDIR